jgi:2-oxoglutarate ferredoxin oxidoreductase subunit beta
MTYLAKPKFHHPGLPKNDLGYTHRDYEGSISTLCAGCGHDSITAAIIEACFELSIEPHKVAKISGIGCSSKTPTYFLGNSHGFNSVHGRMPSVLTGANLANRDLIYLGVSGDGDSASIGFGQFAHVMRRGVNMVYIVENNGVYGLTKGQFSATADRGSKSKRGVINTDNSIDLAAMALQLGATFVARSFSGDKKQLVPIIKAAIEHKGAAFLDVISPCVQQSRRIDQELRLCARAQRGCEPARCDHRPRADHGGLRRRRGSAGRATCRHDTGAAQDRRGLRHP